MGEERCKIYGLRDRATTRYFYVGSTKHTLDQRWRKHREHLESGLNRNLHFTRTINLIGVNNVAIDLLEETEQSDRFRREAFWINSLPGLTNIATNPSGIRPTAFSARDVERKWRSVGGGMPKRFLSLIGQYVETSILTLREIEREMIARGKPLEFS